MIRRAIAADHQSLSHERYAGAMIPPSAGWRRARDTPRECRGWEKNRPSFFRASGFPLTNKKQFFVRNNLRKRPCTAIAVFLNSITNRKTNHRSSSIDARPVISPPN